MSTVTTCSDLELKKIKSIYLGLLKFLSAILQFFALLLLNLLLTFYSSCYFCEWNGFLLHFWIVHCLNGQSFGMNGQYADMGLEVWGQPAPQVFLDKPGHLGLRGVSPQRVCSNLNTQNL